MKDIAIYGAGGLGREVACMLHNINKVSRKWNLIGFFDKIEKGERNEYGEVLGDLEEVNSWKTPLSVVIAIGNSNIVKRLVTSISNPVIDFPNIFATDIFIADENNVSFGQGNIIRAGCRFSCNVDIGNFNILNGFVALGHDVKIGNYNSIMPGVRISGEVTVGDNNFFGVGSIVLQQLKIGNSIKLGAGSVLMTKPKDGCLYIGNPALRFKF